MDYLNLRGPRLSFTQWGAGCHSRRSPTCPGQRPAQATAGPNLPAGEHGNLRHADFAARAFANDTGRPPPRFSEVPERRPQHSQAAVSAAAAYVGIPCHQATHMLVHWLDSPYLIETLRGPRFAQRSAIAQLYPSSQSCRWGVPVNETHNSIAPRSHACPSFPCFAWECIPWSPHPGPRTLVPAPRSPHPGPRTPVPAPWFQHPGSSTLVPAPWFPSSSLGTSCFRALNGYTSVPKLELGNQGV